MKRVVSVMLVMAVMLTLAVTITHAQDEGDCATEFHVRGTSPQQIGQYPDTLVYDGEGVEGLEQGFFELHLDAENNVGFMFSRIYVDSYQLNADTLVEDQPITVIFPLFGSPTGIMPDYWEGGIANCALLHGDSGQEAPILPTVYNDAATWGPAMVFVGDEQVMGAEMIMGAENPLGAFAGHMMFSNEVRDPETGLIANEAGDGPFSPMAPADYAPFEEEASLLHVIVRSEAADEAAWPPFSMFLHFNFLDVEEIDPIEDMQFISMDMMAELDMEQMGMMMGQWMELINSVDEAVTEAAE